MLHPKLVRVDCEDCKVYSYNLRTGERNTYEVEDGSMLPILRTGPPPCNSCPKKSPKHYRKNLKIRYENRLMLDLYHRFKSNPNMRSRLLDYPVTQRNIGLIDRVFDEAKAKMSRKALKRAKRGRR